MLKKALVYLLIALMVVGSTGTFTYAENTDFKDVQDSDWFYEAVMTLSRNGIIAGYEDNTFRPNETVHRDAFATMMVKTLGLSPEKPNSPSFQDVSKDHWAYKYVESSKYYMTGYASNGSFTFKPSDNAVREDMAVALVKALKYDTSGNLGALEKFSDADEISENLKPYVATAVKHNLMAGTPVGSSYEFNPQDDLTRAETAALLMNLIKTEKVVVSDEVKVTFDDSGASSSEAYETPAVKVSASGGKLLVKWDKIDSSMLEGYKIVASYSDSTPVYPENGYYKWITDKNTTSVEISPGAGYNGGDVSKFESGRKIYISITAVYKDKKIPGNVVYISIP